MTVTELRKLSLRELNEKVTDLKEELFNLRFQHAIKQLENPNRIKEVKRDIARTKTLINELQIRNATAFAEYDAEPVKEEKKSRSFLRRRKKDVEDETESVETTQELETEEEIETDNETEVEIEDESEADDASQADDVSENE